jgi:hypothetical protein
VTGRKSEDKNYNKFLEISSSEEMIKFHQELANVAYGQNPPTD